MAFRKLTYYLNNAREIIKCDHTPLCTILTANTLKSKVNNYGTEIININHVAFEKIF